MQSRFSLLVLAAVVSCAAIWLALEHHAADITRRTFINEQAGVASLAAGTFEARLRMPISQAAIMARYDLGDFFQGQGAVGLVVDHLQAGLNAYPDVIAYTLVDARGELVYAQGVQTDAGDTAINQSLAWAKQFRIEAGMQPDALFMTALTPTGSLTSTGVLFPVRLRDETVGALIMALDIRSAARHSFDPAAAVAPGSLCLMERRGVIIYQPEQKDNRASLRNISRKDFQDLLLRTRGAQVGSAIYTQTGGLFGFMRHRILVCWQTVTVGPRSFIVCRTALLRRSSRYYILI